MQKARAEMKDQFEHGSGKINSLILPISSVTTRIEFRREK
jgi:hypothetical protein